MLAPPPLPLSLLRKRPRRDQVINAILVYPTPLLTMSNTPSKIKYAVKYLYVQ